MSRGDQIERHWNLLRILQSRGEGVSLAQLVEALEVSERTIQRDLEALQELGFPIHFEQDVFGKRFWRMPHDFFRSGALTLSLTEAISLHLARRMLTVLEGTHFAAGLDSLLGKIRGLLPQQALDYFSSLSSVLHVRSLGAIDWSRHTETIRTLDTAIQQQRSVRIEYRSLWRRETYTTLFDPYGLVLYADELFLVGRSHRAGALRIFKVNRILELAASDETFERPEEFSLDGFFRTSFGIVRTAAEPTEVVVEFRGVAAAVVEERIWHDSQRLEWLPAQATLFDEPAAEGEALIARFELGDLAEFKRWMKGFTPHAVVLKPEWLREELGRELQAAAREHLGTEAG